MTSVIDPHTIQAYRETDYRVHAGAPFTLRIGEPSAALVSLHDAHNAGCSAFITACNPHSQTLVAAANASRQKMLAGRLKERGLTFVSGVGQHPAGEWKEESFLVLGLPLEEAKALGIEFEQNAIVWSGSDGVPQLVLLR